jgi:hypothetical protein
MRRMVYSILARTSLLGDCVICHIIKSSCFSALKLCFDCSVVFFMMQLCEEICTTSKNRVYKLKPSSMYHRSTLYRSYCLEKENPLARPGGVSKRLSKDSSWG